MENPGSCAYTRNRWDYGPWGHPTAAVVAFHGLSRHSQGRVFPGTSIGLIQSRIYIETKFRRCQASHCHMPHTSTLGNMASKAAISVVNKEKSTDWTKIPDANFGLAPSWASQYVAVDPVTRGRFQGEMDNLVVLGEVPKEINGTWYRLMLDPQFPPHPNNPFIDGDANICAVRFQDGQVDMKIKYLETERYLLERKANKRLFNIYRNPFSHHPCVRNANDSPGNTNIVSWGGQVLALSERGLPWLVDPNTLETKGYDPFAGQCKAKTFTAHPKVDPIRNEMVTWGYEAKGLGTDDVCIYTIDADGTVQDEVWIKDPMCGMAHDAWITENWIVISSMPFRVTSKEEMKKGSQHWEFCPDRPSAFLVTPRKPNARLPHGWTFGEVRRYTYDNAILFHTGAGWEEDEEGILKMESHFVGFNFFFFFNPPESKPPEQPRADYVRWTIDLHQPTETRLQDPQVLCSWICDFPRTDERFLTQRQRIVFFIACDAGKKAPRSEMMFNTIVQLNTETGETMVFDPGDGSGVAEPVFVERSPDAPEGDGWIICWMRRPAAPNGEFVILDTRDFSMPVAVVQMPFAMRTQVHGNWVSNPNPDVPLPKLTRPIKNIMPSNLGPLAEVI